MIEHTGGIDFLECVGCREVLCLEYEFATGECGFIGQCVRLAHDLRILSNIEVIRANSKGLGRISRILARHGERFKS